jgi:hypothetical protein
MSKAKVLADINAALFVPVFKGQVQTQAEEAALGISFLAKVASSGDPELQKLLQAWVSSDFGYDEEVDLFVYIFETLPKLLQ